MKRMFIIIPTWQEDAKECFIVEYHDNSVGSATSAEVLYVDKEEYEVIFQMIKMVWDEQKIFNPQNHLPL